MVLGRADATHGQRPLRTRGLTASAAIGPRILNRPGGMRDLEEQALAALADGRLSPLVQRFALAEAAAAHAALEARATVGKAVLVP
jgi:NADPH:quinone reductase